MCVVFVCVCLFTNCLDTFKEMVEPIKVLLANLTNKPITRLSDVREAKTVFTAGTGCWLQIL